MNVYIIGTFHPVSAPPSEIWGFLREIHSHHQVLFPIKPLLLLNNAGEN